MAERGGRAGRMAQRSTPGTRRSGAAELPRDVAEIQARHLELQRAERDSEIAGGRGHVPVGFLERTQDEVALERVARLLEKSLCRRRARVELGEVILERQVLVGDPLLVRPRAQPFDQILELADVAGP